MALAQAAGRVALGGEPAVERVGAEVLLDDEDGVAVGRQAGAATSAAARAGRPCRCGSAGSTRSRRSGRPPARPRGRTTRHRHPVGRRVRRAQRPGPLVDVDGPHVERRRRAAPSSGRSARRRTRDRAPTPVAGSAGAARSRTAVPASRRPWLNTPRSVRIVNDDVAEAPPRTVASADVAPGEGSK